MLKIKEQEKFDPTVIFIGLTVLLIACTAGFLVSPYYQYSFLPAAAVLSLVVFARYPEIGYYLIIALTPFAAFRGKIHWVIAVILCLILFFYYLAKKTFPDKLRSNLWPWLLAFFLVNLISALLSEYSPTAFRSMFRLTSSYLFIATGFLLISYKGMGRIIPLIIVAGISISAFLAVLGFFFDIALFAPTENNFKRATGGATSPIALSMMIVFGIPVLLHCLSYSRLLWQRALFTFLLVINLLGMVTTYSRGGALILVFILGILSLGYIRKLTPKKIGMGFLGLGAFIVIALTFVPASYWERQGSVKDRSDSSISRRLSYLNVGLEAFKEDPIIGSGSGTFMEIYARSNYAAAHQRKNQESFTRHAHNTYLEVLVGTGIIGVLIFLGILWCTITNFSRAKNAFLTRGNLELASLMGAFRLSLLSIMIYLFIQSAIDNKFFLMLFALSHVGLRYSKMDNAGIQICRN